MGESETRPAPAYMTLANARTEEGRGKREYITKKGKKTNEEKGKEDSGREEEREKKTKERKRKEKRKARHPCKIAKGQTRTDAPFFWYKAHTPHSTQHACKRCARMKGKF